MVAYRCRGQRISPPEKPTVEKRKSKKKSVKDGRLAAAAAAAQCTPTRATTTSN